VVMNKIIELGEVALASRFKMISDYLYAHVDKVYKEKNMPFQSRWFILVHLLNEHGEMSVTELADELGQSHSAVSQLTKKLISKHILSTKIDSKDERRRLLYLSDEGKELFNTIRPLCYTIEKSINQYILDSGYNLMETLRAFEKQLEKHSFSDDILRRLNISDKNQVEIVSYRPEYKEDFKRLNIEWLEKYFYVESFDNEVLSNPETYILSKGGYIYFACFKGEVVGTCALMKDSDSSWELTKMAVTEHYQGLKIGHKLAQKIIDTFLSFNSGTLFLETNSKLIPAIRLYEKLGFVQQENPKEGSHYSRANVYMIYKPL